ncbi:MAG: hypothetical protein EZS28_012672 [Streblomastix strix]|uniref:Uncharacterized protein n=1 Tax=Streblomastix strix TaxID=222440 RepID=A0A5J4WAK3_9EUKA|nr:MAG: hypothetical protein EZS28_012672 [Streblomastix strix]
MRLWCVPRQRNPLRYSPAVIIGKKIVYLCQVLIHFVLKLFSDETGILEIESNEELLLDRSIFKPTPENPPPPVTLIFLSASGEFLRWMQLLCLVKQESILLMILSSELVEDDDKEDDYYDY